MNGYERSTRCMCTAHSKTELAPESLGVIEAFTRRRRSCSTELRSRGAGEHWAPRQTQNVCCKPECLDRQGFCPTSLLQDSLHCQLQPDFYLEYLVFWSMCSFRLCIARQRPLRFAFGALNRSRFVCVYRAGQSSGWPRSRPDRLATRVARKPKLSQPGGIAENGQAEAASSGG